MGRVIASDIEAAKDREIRANGPKKRNTEEKRPEDAPASRPLTSVAFTRVHPVTGEVS